MTSKTNTAPLLYYIKHCASFQSHWWIQTGVTVRKCSIRVKIDDFFSRKTLQFDVWSWKTIGHLFYATSSFVHHFAAIGGFKLESQSGNAQFGSNSTILIAVYPWNLMDDLEKELDTSSMLLQALYIISKPLVNFKTGVTVRKRPIWVKFDDFYSRVSLKLIDDLEKE